MLLPGALNKENAPSNKAVKTPNTQRTGQVSSTRASMAVPGSAVWTKPDSEPVSSFMTSQRVTMRQAYMQKADAMRTTSRQAITHKVKQKDISDSGICLDSDDERAEKLKKDRTTIVEFPRQRPAGIFMTSKNDADDESASPPILEKDEGRQSSFTINRSISRVGLSMLQDQSATLQKPFLQQCLCSQTFDNATLQKKAGLLAG